MKQIRLILPALLSLLLLASCGASDPGGAEDTLRRENDALRQQITALEAERDALSQENETLKAENAALNDTAPESGDEEANPIDRFFDATDTGSSTAEMNLVADSWAESWKAEAEHAAEWLKEQLPLQEDQELVDAYMAAAAEQAGRIQIMAIYPIADLTVSQADRAAFSGSLRGVLWAGARQQLWKDTFYQLLYVAPDYASGVDSAVSYQFIFSAGAMQEQLDAARSDF